MKLIIAGSRSIDENTALRLIDDYLSYIPLDPTQITEVVSGGARGPDRAGEFWAMEHGIPVKVFEADWAQYGRSAGVRRNRVMAEYIGPEGALLPIWDGKSPGTLNMMCEALMVGSIILGWRYDGERSREAVRARWRRA